MHGDRKVKLSMLSSIMNLGEIYAKKCLVSLLSVVFSIFVFGQVQADGGPVVTPDDARSHGLESLRTIVNTEGVPVPSNIGDIIADRTMAEALGKALFHEMMVGSDGIQACVTCHFAAGADPRSINQLSPGLLRVKSSRDGDTKGHHGAEGAADTLFEVVTGTPSTTGPNYLLERWDFPLVRDIGNGDNVVEVADGVYGPAPGNSNDTVSSMGILNTLFVDTNGEDREDIGEIVADPIFNVGGINTRRVEPRNTPTTINAVFNFYNFWDGRANNRCNGQDVFGHTSTNPPNSDLFGDPLDNDDTPRILVDDGSGAKIITEKLDIRDSSLCSQALGPPLSHFEMSFGDGALNARKFVDIADKILYRKALSTQRVHKSDSLLGPMRDTSWGYYSKGLKHTYEEMIQVAFKEKFWNSTDTVTIDGESMPLIKANFSFYWGVSLMLYQATLISDQSPFDQWMEGDGSFVRGFKEKQLRGLNVFVNEGKCVNCHGGPELTNASVRNAQRGHNLIEPMRMRDLKPAIYDNGFYNIGVTPTTEDLGRGGMGTDDKPLSNSRQFAFQALGIDDMGFSITGDDVPNLECKDSSLTPGDCDILGVNDEETGLGFIEVCEDTNRDGLCSACRERASSGVCKDDPATKDVLLLTRVAVDGSFKTPGLRNVALTAPYMHNGGFASLLEVVQFYNRGGNFCRTNKADLDPDIRGLGLSDAQEKDLVAFLIALTDKRVLRRKAPFDAPEFAVPVGAHGDHISVADRDLDGQADEDLYWLPAVGKRGGSKINQFLGGYIYHFSANPVAGGVCSPDIPLEQEQP